MLRETEICQQKIRVNGALSVLFCAPQIGLTRHLGWPFSVLGAVEMGFTKLHERLVQSSIMAEDPKTFKIFIALLASCGPDGIAQVSSTFLSAACYMPIEDIDNALAILEAPDKRSRSLDEEGRRIKRVDGGYFIINYKKYRGFDYSTKTEAVRKRIYRMGHSSGHSGTILGHPVTVAGRSASASASYNLDSSSLRGGSRGGDKIKAIDEVIRSWNEFAKKVGLPLIYGVPKGSPRERALTTRMNQEGWDMDKLTQAISASSFLLGQKGKFRATFDWVINPTNYLKIIEGNYLDREEHKEPSWVERMEEEEKREKENNDKKTV